MNHSITNNIVKLMKNIVELGIISGKYIGIYAKDSLDELLLISHQNSSYKGKSREIERTAVSEYIKWLRVHYSDVRARTLVEKNEARVIEKEITKLASSQLASSQLASSNVINDVINESKDVHPGQDLLESEKPLSDQFPVYNHYIGRRST